MPRKILSTVTPYKPLGVVVFYVQGAWHTIKKINYYPPLPHERDVYFIHPIHSSWSVWLEWLNPAAEKRCLISMLWRPQWFPSKNDAPFVFPHLCCRELMFSPCYFYLCTYNGIQYDFHIRRYSSCRSYTVTTGFITGFVWSFVVPSLYFSVYCFVYLDAFLFLFFWPLHCLFLINLRILVAIWYLQICNAL